MKEGGCLGGCVYGCEGVRSVWVCMERGYKVHFKGIEFALTPPPHTGKVLLAPDGEHILVGSLICDLEVCPAPVWKEALAKKNFLDSL